MSALVDLRDHLIREGVTTPITLGRRPDTPDTIITLQSYPGDPGSLPDARGRPLDERLAVQIVTRASDQATAEAVAHDLYTRLPARHLTVNGRVYAWIEANHYPAFMGVDANGRPLVVLNVTARRHGLT